MGKRGVGAAGASGSGSAGKRLAARAALICLPPPLALLAGLSREELAFCTVTALVWTVLEAAVVFRVTLAAGCKQLPFGLRLVVGLLLDAQGCWLLHHLHGFQADAAGGSLRGAQVPAALDPVADAAARAVVDERTAASAEGGHIPGQDAWWLKDSRPPPPQQGRVDTVTVVLPCANETDFVAKTVRSVFESTPQQELLEILVIDDFSHPPISTLIPEADLTQFKARILRHDSAEGLIRSKKHGGDAASGDVVVFLDCHVKPAEGWTRQILQLIRQNNRRIIVPAITSLDPEAWKELSPVGGATKMCLTWNADFHWCNGYQGPYVPIMSGGLLALSRWWWQATGGYDEDMHAWGGENLDQSLRTWLCGGEILAAKESRVAHMWRDPNKPHTRLKYSIPTDHVRRNRLRAARAWMGPWADKVATFPEFEDFQSGGRLNIGTLESYDYYKEKLNCKTFDWYLNRFKDYYLGTGQLPSDTFNLREKSTGLCLTGTMNAKGKPEKFQLWPCNQQSEMQRFHYANFVRGTPGRCCSGIRMWNFDACIAANSIGSESAAAPCDSFGGSPGQRLVFRDGYMERNEKNGRGCLATREGQGAADKLRARSSQGALDGESRSDDLIKFSSCAAPDGTRPKRGQEFKRQSEAADGSFQLAEPAAGLCLGIVGAGRQGKLAMRRCDEDATRWTMDHGLIKNVRWDLCIDAADNQVPIPYPCYPAGSNPKQVYKLHDNGWIEQPRTWNDNGRNRWPAKCLDSRPLQPVAVQLTDCARVGDPNWEQLWHEVPMETQLWNAVADKFSS